MKFVIQGKQYDAEESIAKVSLTTLYELKLKYGIGMKTIIAHARMFENMTDPLELLEDDGAFQVFMAVIWITRRHAGEKLTMEEANDFPLDSMELVIEDDEPVAAPDPKAPAVSGPAGKPAAVARATSKTSKRRSTPTS